MNFLGRLERSAHLNAQVDGSLFFPGFVIPRGLNSQDGRHVFAASRRAVVDYDQSLRDCHSVFRQFDPAKTVKLNTFVRKDHRPLVMGADRGANFTQKDIVVCLCQQVPVVSDMRGGSFAHVRYDHTNLCFQPTFVGPHGDMSRPLGLNLQPRSRFSQRHFRCGLGGSRSGLRTLGGFLGQPQLAEDERQSNAIQKNGGPSSVAFTTSDPGQCLRERPQPDRRHNGSRADQPAQNALAPRLHRTGIAGVARSDQPLGAFA